jgi:hypothetical protein
MKFYFVLSVQFMDRFPVQDGSESPAGLPEALVAYLKVQIKENPGLKLGVADLETAKLIQDEQLGDVECIANASINELLFCIRIQFRKLIGESSLEAEDAPNLEVATARSKCASPS